MGRDNDTPGGAGCQRLQEERTRGCWAALAFLITIAVGLVFVVNSILEWLKPSENLLGR